MCTIKVGSGDEAMTYVMHRDVAAIQSPYFDKVFNGPFLEGKSQEVVLDDFPWPDVFGLVQGWIYTQKLLLDETGSEYSLGPQLYKLWILADRLLMPKLQNAIIEEIRVRRLRPQVCLFNWIYQNTTSTSTLRLLIANICAEGVHNEIYTSWVEKDYFPSELLLDMARVNHAFRKVGHTLKSGWDHYDWENYKVSEEGL